MRRLNNHELALVVGGFSFNLTGVIINALVNAGKFIFDTGRNVGSSIRRISGNNLCPLR